MAKYAKIRTTWVVSDNSDYSDATTYELEDTDAPTIRLRQTLPTAVGGVTVTTDTLTTVEKLVVQNMDATDDITIGYTSADGGIPAEILLPAGRWIVIEDIDPSADLLLTASANTPSAMVDIWGC